ncbi:calcineurin temperature suppressor Cts1 [Cryptococcus neoformans c45]|nr:calcineurin temperature suppressor Cts1 [Cryptococcus neoformans var. grubii c45]
MNTSVEPKELGTLIVVVGKARNLPNKSRFGKQDPFCTVIVGEEKQKTKPIKRGGQHPEWDEEFRFAILEDVDDVIQRSESQSESLNSSLNDKPLPVPDDPGVITTAALASKSRKAKKKGGKSMKVACYAHEAKGPELIGDCVVSLEDVLKKGEVDDWYDFQYKEKYSGEIYLELTFFSNEAPPVKRNVPRPSIPGYVPPSLNGSESSMSLGSKAGRGALPQMSSGSISGAHLYIPPYAPQAARIPSPANQPGQSNSFAELGLPPGHRANSPLPPIQQTQYGYQPLLSSSLSVNSWASVDLLTRPMSSMSLNPSVHNLPMSSTPAPSEPSSSYGQPAAHRHSFGGSSEGPWGSVLPHSGYVPAPTPQPRSTSTQPGGAGSEAPWGSMLPQSHPAPAASTPHHRPMSTNDALTWEQTMRMEADRLRATATPMPRPPSGMSYGAAPAGLAPPVAPMPVPSQQDSRIPSTIPESLRPAGPPQLHQQFSQPPSSFTPNQYHNQPQTPVPPLHSHSAHSASPVSTTSGHYQVPSSSFSGLAQPPADLRRTPSPDPGYYAQQSAGQFQPQPQSQVNGAYESPIGGGYGQQQGYSTPTPTRSNVYPVPPTQDHQQPPPSSQGYCPPQPPQTPQPYPPQSSQTPQPFYQASSSPAHQQQPPLPPAPQQSYPYSQSLAVPHRHPSPAPPPPLPQTNESGYVPWYQQTQSAQPHPQSLTPYPQSHTPQPQSLTPYPQSYTPAPQSHTPQPQSYPYAQQPYGQQPQVQNQQTYHQVPPAPQYSQSLPLPPPVPERRPQPQAPAPPPCRLSVGYYPSDELYVQKQEGRDPYGR